MRYVFSSMIASITKLNYSKMWISLSANSFSAQHSGNKYQAENDCNQVLTLIKSQTQEIGRRGGRGGEAHVADAAEEDVSDAAEEGRPQRRGRGGHVRGRGHAAANGQAALPDAAQEGRRLGSQVGTKKEFAP